jgi:hypothetical protein
VSGSEQVADAALLPLCALGEEQAIAAAPLPGEALSEEKFMVVAESHHLCGSVPRRSEGPKYPL